mgnify:CR=1 FL=1
MIAFPASIHYIVQLVSKPKESKAQVSNIKNSQYRDTFDTCSIGQALVPMYQVAKVYQLCRLSIVAYVE